jgi:SAM-dependent methyltransferase
MSNLNYTRYYTKWHSDSDAYVSSAVEYNKQKLSQLLIDTDKDAYVLDIGCGMGFCMMALKELGFKNVIGVDTDEGQVASCNKKGLIVSLVKDTEEYLRNLPNKLGAVILFDVLEHIPVDKQVGIISSIYDQLTNNGKLLCTVPNANSVISSRWRYNDFTHYSSFTEHSLDFVLFNGGFHNIEIREIEFFKKPFLINFYSLKSYLRIFKNLFWKTHLHWWLFKFFRSVRRLQFIAELGWEQGKEVPLSLNLLAIARKEE